MLSKLANPTSKLASDVSKLGADATDFSNAEVSVDQEGKGFGEVIVLITIFAPAANHVIKSAWDKIVLPQIRSRLGADAIGKEVEKQDGNNDAGSENS